MTNQNLSKKKKFKIPHTYVILFLMIVIMAICTYIIPAGQFERVEEINTGRSVVDPASFHYVEQSPVNFFDVFYSVPSGMKAAAEIIFLIFIVGGSFQIIAATGAVEAGVCKAALSLRGKEKIIIPMFVLIFSILGGSIGMAEETIVFIPIGIALARALGYDALVGSSMIILGACCGFSSGFLNPFTVGVAQGIAELPLFSGIGLRLIVWAVMITVTSIYILRYAKKVKEDPSISIVRQLEIDEEDSNIDLSNIKPMTINHVLVMLTFVIGLGAMIYGIFKLGWYLMEISTIFLMIGIFGGLIGKLDPSEMAKQFVIGAKEIVFGALVVGVARGILIVMQDGMIIDSIVSALGNVILGLPKTVAAVAMMLVQVIINFFIPSGSGQAAATMPIMAPLADFIGLTRQTAVLGYQFGDGFTNSIIPTSAALMGNLSMAKIPYEKWVKYVAPIIGIWLFIGATFMIIATIMNYGPF